MKIRAALTVAGVSLAAALLAAPAGATSSGGKWVFGTFRSDTITGTAADELVIAFSGNDRIAAGEGNDIVLAGSGRDRVSGDAGDDQLYGYLGDDVLDGGSGSDLLDGGAGSDTLIGGPDIDTLVGGRGRDAFVFDGDPFRGVDVSAAGRQVVNTPDELPDFSIEQDALVGVLADLGLSGPQVFVNGTAEQLTALAGTDANVVVIQGAIGNAGAAATAVANTGVADGPGVFVYWNTSLLINRLVYSSDLGDPTADISILANIRSLEGDAALDALPAFSASNFGAA